MEKENLIKIAIVGPESTGKSTLAAQLADAFNTVYLSEYARSFFDEHNINYYTLKDLETIYRQQLLEESFLLKNAEGILFSDTALISGRVWATEVFQELPPVLSDESLSKHSQHFYVLCDTDLPWVEDPQRKNPHNRKHLFERHVEELKRIGAEYAVITGLNEERFDNALKAVQAFLKTVT